MKEVQAPGCDPIPDATLVERVIGGDERAFEVLYERYFPRVYRYATRRLSNRADVEESVQEVFINVFSSIDSWRGTAPFGAWVLGVAKRTVASRFKRKYHPTVPLEGSEEAPVDVTLPLGRREPTPHEQAECGERIAQLEHVVAVHLSPEQRVLFQWHHLEDRSIRDIARALRKSPDAVKSNLYRTRKLLLAR